MMAAGIHYQEVAHSAAGTSANTASQTWKTTPTAPVAIQIEPTERTPLIKKKVTFAEPPKASKCSIFLDFKMFLIGLLLIVGFSIATYLLIVDNQVPPVRYAVDLVSREAWSATPHAFMGTQMLNPANVMNVLITQTGGEDCYDMESCIRLLRLMEASQHSRNEEIPYNFMIGGDGEIYEGKGWSHLSGFPSMPQETSLVISFIGNFTKYEPPQDQLDAGKALLEEALKHGKLVPNYVLYGMQNLTISHEEGSALYADLSGWPHFDTILKVL
ncbi:unnamed protein product [Hermetia illucens]|uniref:Peptidoglycan recognition protein family domain-containing protein n=1 Tax=Hermetia illucens TaxID=343691 RepID=A0A7R8UN65_HERIL|nr:peptidoglycan-recognition protein SD-like isoform X1 [Hermetia illucens]CAD7083047.1 unnamed protein product [Hermetia illucens]